MNRLKAGYILLILSLLVSCNKDVEVKEEKEALLFESIPASQSGVDFENNLVETDSLNILDYLYFYNGGGVAIGDINNDELPDIFFTSNQGANQLYLNEGGFKFRNITEEAGVGGSAGWNTGVTMADVNGDGFLDIYVVAVSGIFGLTGRNELFINNGDGTFTEMASEYGIDLQNYGTTAAFFDYDNDGFLDLFVLNHAVHTEDSFGPAEIRNRRNELSGDKLFRFNGEKFEDVSEEAGIYGGPNGYGLGLATADFNNDGFVDIYVSNDFHEDDYLYINNGDGTFSEVMKEQITQMSRFSMGNDVADINHDGYPDLLTLDMLPEDETVLKSSMGDEDINVANLRQKFGYHRQYSRNMLQLNKEGKGFQEIALLSGVAATDWSWSPLFADYDQDGEIDLFITNGIIKRPNDLDYIKYLSNNQIKKSGSTQTIDRKALELMPGGKVRNYIYRGSNDLVFEDKSTTWMEDRKTFSNGSAYGDLDNDGDLDLVVNNLNGPALLYRNAGKPGNNYLKLRFRAGGGNTRGLGTKAYSWHNGILQYEQLFTSKGFQSSSEDILHFGYGAVNTIDSLIVVWPNQKTDKKYNVKVNQTLELTPPETTAGDMVLRDRKNTIFEKIDSLPGLDYVHQENTYNDFDRQKLIPYRISDSGPAVAIGDLNNDGKEDIFIGNSRGFKAEVYFQTSTGFENVELSFLEETKNLEITSVVIADFSGNGYNDIFYVTGGGEFSAPSEVLRDACWSYNGQTWERIELPDYYSSAGVIKAADYDNDGDLDVFIGGRAVAGDFGKIPESFLLQNNNGKFERIPVPELEYAGMVTDAVWSFSNDDQYPDLIVVGEWMAPKIFKNSKGKLKEETPPELKLLKGLWQSITQYDLDNDGQQEILLGNWGLNTKFKASSIYPLKMYYGDVDGNGATETIVAGESRGEYYTFAGLDELVSQMSYLRREFPGYKDFAGKNVQEIFGREKLNEMAELEVNNLSSGYLKENNGEFKFVPFKKILQFAPINAILVENFTNSTKSEVVLGGNYFGITPYHGAHGAFPGAYMDNDKVLGGIEAGLDFTGKAVRALKTITFAGQKYLLVFINDEPLEVYKINMQ